MIKIHTGNQIAPACTSCSTLCNFMDSQKLLFNNVLLMNVDMSITYKHTKQFVSIYTKPFVLSPTHSISHYTACALDLSPTASQPKRRLRQSLPQDLRRVDVGMCQGFSCYICCSIFSGSRIFQTIEACGMHKRS